MRLSDVDLNLFVVFDAIYTERNLTRAAQVLHISQPAASNALARLRRTFNDELFVRTAKGMVPTPVADNVIDRVRESLQLMHTSLNEADVFDPATSEKTFRISMNDMAEAFILPGLEQRLMLQAPNVRIECYYTARDALKHELASGTVDLAVDAPMTLHRQLCHASIAPDRYVCMLRREHPLARAQFALDDYLSLGHIQVSSRPKGGGYIEAALTALGETRRVQLRVQHHMIAALIASQTNLALTAPINFLTQFDAALMELPFAIEPPANRLYWHASADADHANRWLRDQVLQLAQGTGQE
ncbi:MAG: LysR family transcriptional regulator [Halieaceae bacterium]|jgi:DNA-binding transcriptional LysR family regulator|nr:LysR family transcriptional regulator [Halieaceae bacterium]